MFDRTGLNRLRVLRGQYRTISFVQYLRCCGTKQRPAEETSVCGHDVEIESVCVGELWGLRTRAPRARIVQLTEPAA